MRRTVISCLCLLPAFAPALTITFDEFGTPAATFDAAVPVNDRYLAQGVKFRGPGGSTEIGGMMLNDSTFTIHAHSGNNFLALNAIREEQIFFTSPMSAVSIYAANVDTSKHASFTMSAYDAGGNLVDSNTVSPSVITWAQLSVSAASISEVVLTESSGAFTYVYDDLTATPAAVPEPASMAFLALGAAALVRKNRRAQR